MNHRIAMLSGAVCAAVLMVAWSAAARTDYYTSGFYTRGSDAAAYIDQGGSIMDPFYLPVQEWSLLPRMTLTATRDDNIFLNAENEEDATTIDFIPGLLFIYGRPDRNHLYADTGMIIPVYDSSDELDQDPSYLLTLGGVYDTGRSQLTGRGGYRRAENVDTLVGARIVKEDYLANLGVEHRVSSKSSVGANGSFEWNEYDNDAYYDYNRYYGSGRAYHRATAKSDVFVQAGAGRDDVDAPADAGDVDFVDLSLGVRGKQSPKTSVSGRVGYMWRQYIEGDRDDVNDWIAGIGAETIPFGFTTFTADLTADIRPAINSLGTSAINHRLTLGVNRRLFIERLRGNVSVYYGQVQYEGDINQPADPNDRTDLVYDGREDDYWGYSIGVDWWTVKNVSLGLAYSYAENNGSENGTAEEQELTSYDSGRWILRISWNY